MSPIAVPFDNIAHSQLPHQKKKAHFRSFKGRTIEGVRYTIKRIKQLVNVQFRPFHLMHAVSSLSPSSGHRFATYATENPETRSQI